MRIPQYFQEKIKIDLRIPPGIQKKLEISYQALINCLLYKRLTPRLKKWIEPKPPSGLNFAYSAFMIKNIAVLVVSMIMFSASSQASVIEYATQEVNAAKDLLQRIEKNHSNHFKIEKPEHHQILPRRHQSFLETQTGINASSDVIESQIRDLLKTEAFIREKEEALDTAKYNEGHRWYNRLFKTKSEEIKKIESLLNVAYAEKKALETEIKSELHVLKKQRAHLHSHHKDSKDSRVIFNHNLIRMITEMPELAVNTVKQYTQGGLSCFGWFDRFVNRIWKSRSALNIKNSMGTLPLIEAASRGYSEIVKELLKTREVLLNEQDDDGNTAAMRAALAGHEDIVYLLKSQGASLEIKNKKGKSPRSVLKANHTARKAKEYWSTVFSVLSGKQALTEPTLENLLHSSFQRIPFEQLNSRQLEQVITSVEKKHSPNALMNACIAGDTKQVNRLLNQSNTRIDDVDSNGNSALMLAIIHGHREIAQKLLRSGARVDTVNAKGENYLHLFKSEMNFQSEVADGKLTADAVSHLLHREGIPFPSEGLNITELKDSKSLGRTAGQLFLLKTPSGRLVYVVKKTEDEDDKDACRKEASNLNELYSEKRPVSDLRRRRLEKQYISHFALGIDPAKASPREKSQVRPLIVKASLPKFAQLEKAIFYQTPVNDNQCLLVLHGAQGSPLHEIAKSGTFEKTPGDAQTMQEAYSKMGESLGAFHFNSVKEKISESPKVIPFSKLTTEIHGDIHWGNAFYDKVKKQISFIDNEGNREGSPKEDLLQIFRGLTDIAKTVISGYQKHVEGLYKQKVPVDQIVSIDVQRIHRPFCAMQNFQDAYIRSYPSRYQKELEKTLSIYIDPNMNLCNASFKKFGVKVQRHFCEAVCTPLTPVQKERRIALRRPTSF